MTPKIDNVPREIFDKSRSKREKYQDLVIGQPGWGPLLRHEAILTLTGHVPGALGLFLRSRVYPLLLGACGRNVFFGVGVTLRHPHKICIGNDVVIDDGCVLDAKGSSNTGITIGNGVFLGRHSNVNTKDGDIILEDGVNVGAFCTIFSASHVRCGQNTLFAAYSYVVGGGHDMKRTDVAVIDQTRPSRGIDIGPNCWIGAGTSVLDGVTIGRDAVIGANSVVTKDVAAFSITAGSPSEVIRVRHSATTK